MSRPQPRQRLHDFVRGGIGLCGRDCRAGGEGGRGALKGQRGVVGQGVGFSEVAGVTFESPAFTLARRAAASAYTSMEATRALS